MWKILFADDEAIYHASVKEDILDNFFTPDIGVVEATDNAFKDAANSANKLLEKSKYHLAFIDSYFERENDVVIDGKAYIASVLGEGLIEKNRSQPFPYHYFFITAYQNKYTNINSSYEKYINDSMVTPFPKERICEADWKIMFVDKLRNQLKLIARQLLLKLDFNQKRCLIERINSQSLNDAEIVKIEDENWTIKALCAGWWNFEKKIMEEDMSKIIRSLITPDITLAVSEVFGVFGVKQITHADTNYFPFQNIEQIAEELNRQFDYLDKVLKETKEAIGTDLLSLCDFKDQYIAFKKNALSKAFTLGKQDDDLLMERNSNFRFGSMPSVEGDRKTIHINSTFPSDFLRDRDLGKFEINIPIHDLFVDCFKRVLTRSNSERKYGLCSYKLQNDPLAHPSNVQPLNKSYLYYNYLIIPSGNIFPVVDILNGSPDHFQCYWNKHFGYFGEYFVATNVDKKWSVFNCTWQNSICEVPIINAIPEDCKLTIKLFGENAGNDNTFHIFLFKTWRQ